MEHTNKYFDLGDILSITTGRLVSPRHIDGVSAILNYMTSVKNYSHQLPRASDACMPALLEQHPQLRNVRVPSKKTTQTWQNAEWMAWLDRQKQIYGAQLPVKPLLVYEVESPIAELAKMMGGNVLKHTAGDIILVERVSVGK